MAVPTTINSKKNSTLLLTNSENKWQCLGGKICITVDSKYWHIQVLQMPHDSQVVDAIPITKAIMSPRIRHVEKFLNDILLLLMRFTPCQSVEMLFICQSPFGAARSRMDAWISLKCNPCKRVRLCELLAPVPVLSGCLSVNRFGLLSSLALFISQFTDGLGFCCSKPPPSLPLRQQHP